MAETPGANSLSSNRILIMIVALALILAAVAASLNSSREVEELSANSPEGVVQLFLEAVVEGKSEDAEQYFSSTSSGGLFADNYIERHNYRLAKESGSWRILGIPWPLYSCGEPPK